MNNHNNSEGSERWANSGYHIGLLEKVLERIVKEPWTKIIK